MNTAEQKAHEALTRITAAMDWMHRAGVGEGWTGNWNAALNNVWQEMREAKNALAECWVECDDCGDRLWRDLVCFNPDAGPPDLETGGYTGKHQCQPCHRMWQNREPGDAYHERLAETVADRKERERRELREAGRS